MDQAQVNAIEELLGTIAADDRDFRGENVSPNANRSDELGGIIAVALGNGARSVRFTYSELEAGRVRDDLARAMIPAEPNLFVGRTLNAVLALIAELESHKATKIQVVLSNRPDNGANLHGDKCLLAIRYSS